MAPPTSCKTCPIPCAGRAATACKKQRQRVQRRALRDRLAPRPSPAPGIASEPRKPLLNRLFTRLFGAFK